MVKETIVEVEERESGEVRDSCEKMLGFLKRGDL